MVTTSTRVIITTFTGGTVAQDNAIAAANPASPGVFQLINLASGANTITPPTGGASVTGVTINLPTGNTQTVTLKGVTGDTGVQLHPTDPTSLGLAASPGTFVLTAGGIITGVQLIWT